MAATFPREDLHTVQLVPLTAFDERGALALEPMRALTERIFAAGVRVFIPCAGSAEFHSLSSDEVVAAIAMTRDVVGDQARVIAPVGQQISAAIELGQRSAAAGADALLVMPLAFPYLSNQGANDYYRALLDQVDCPCLVYKKADIPGDDLLLVLAEHPRMIGVKHAVNDLDGFHQLVQRDGGRVDWFCGSAERFAPYYALAGSPGYTSGAGNLCPRVTLAMHAALAAGAWQEAMRLQKLLLPIEHYRARQGSSYNISFLKYAITHTGLDFGQPRPPQRRLTTAERREVDEMMPAILSAERELESAATV